MYGNQNRETDRLLDELLLEILIAQIQDLQTLHQHTCEQCNTSWLHTGRQAGNDQAHMCPRCNTGPYWIRT